LGLLLASVVSAALLAYFATRSAEVPSARTSASASESEADVKRAPPPAGRRGPEEKGADIVAEPVPAKLTPEQIALFRQPPSEVNPAVKERGIAALTGRPSCIAPSVPVEVGPKGPGGIGCAITQKNGPILRVGQWAFRDELGIVQSGVFENGMRTGVWTAYHANGFKASEGEYRDDQPDGVWNEWDSEGRFVARRTFKMGMLDGVTVLFRGENEPLVETWRNGMRLGDEPQPSPPSPR
jgi:hypothetical protein